MALTERQRSRIRDALDHVLKAEQAVAVVADDLAHIGLTEHDPTLDRVATLFGELVAALEPLAGGAARTDVRAKRS